MRRPEPVKLVSFSTEHLRLDAPLPFGVRDATGRLLLTAGASITRTGQLEQLRSLPLFADEDETTEWRRKLGATVGVMLRQNTTLKAIAEARPQDGGRDGLVSADPTVPEQWDSLCTGLDLALREARPGPEFIARVRQLHERASKLGQRQADASLYHLIHGAGHSTARYGSHHALLVMLVCEQAAPVLGWSPQAVRSLACAALSMNVAMAALQDQLAASDAPITAAMRAQIQAHPEQGAMWLRQAGLDDARDRTADPTGGGCGGCLGAGRRPERPQEGERQRLVRLKRLQGHGVPGLRKRRRLFGTHAPKLLAVAGGRRRAGERQAGEAVRDDLGNRDRPFGGLPGEGRGLSGAARGHEGISCQAMTWLDAGPDA